MNKIRIIDESLIGEAVKKAEESDRKRSSYNLHKDFSDKIQRMLFVINKDSYVQPHKHENPDKVEVFICLKGKLAILIFNDEGEITNKVVISEKGNEKGVEVFPRTWHSIIALEDNSVCYEIKEGPYNPETDKKFASWAPKENSEEVAEYLKGLIQKIKD